MANATKYVDNVNGNNANTGDSEAQAYADIATAIAAITGGGNTIYVQAAGSNYTLTTANQIAALSGDTTNGRNKIEGYTTTPGARDGRPTITSATNSINLFELHNGSAGWNFCHLELTHTAGTRGSAIAGTGTAGSTNFNLEDCLVDGCRYAIDGTSRSLASVAAIASTIRNCTTGAILTGSGGVNVIDGCLIYANTGIIYTANNQNDTLLVSRSILSGGTKAISDGNAGSVRTFALYLVNSTIRGQSSAGIIQENSASSWTIHAAENNIFYGISGYAWSLLDSANLTLFNTYNHRNNFKGSLSSGYHNNFSNGYNLVDLSADPFVDAANGDFRLNTTSGGGAAIRAAGFPGTFPGGTATVGYLDGGAVQHQDAGGGSGGGLKLVGRGGLAG